MHLPSIILALLLSAAASVATIRYVMPPLDAEASTTRPTMNRVRCEGYVNLHLLLKSESAANDFIAHDPCGVILRRVSAMR